MTSRPTTWILAFLLVLAACRQQAPPSPTGPTGGRLVSLAPSITETLFALGVGDRVVAVTQNDSFPPDVEGLPKVGGIQPDLERLLALKPDLILVDRDLNADQIGRLRQLGLPVGEFGATDLEGLLKTIEEIGAAVGAESSARELRAKLSTGLSTMARQVEAMPRRPTVFVEIWPQPLMSAGAGSYVGELVERAGGANVCGHLSGYPRVSDEQILLFDPEVIVLTVSTPEQAAARPGWGKLKAVRQRAVHRIDSDLLARPSPRVLEALQELHGWFRSRVER